MKYTKRAIYYLLLFQSKHTFRVIIRTNQTHSLVILSSFENVFYRLQLQC